MDQGLGGSEGRRRDHMREGEPRRRATASLVEGTKMGAKIFFSVKNKGFP